MGPSQPQSAAARRPPGKPNCTHIVMDRYYGNSRCDSCLQIPPMGFLYTCRQDFGHNEPRNSTRQLPFTAISSNADFSSASLKSLGLSRSVIDAAEKGIYTPAQLNSLVAQKTNLHMVIALQQNDNHQRVPSSPTETSASNPTWSLANTPRRKKSVSNESNSGSLNSRIKLPRRVRKVPKCKAKFCPRCRPYFKERAYLSFDAVFAGEVEPLTAKEIPSLKIGDASIIRNIDMHSPPPLSPSHTDGSTDFPSTANESHTTLHTTDTDIETINQGVKLAKQFYKVERDPAADARVSPNHIHSRKPGLRSTLMQAYYDVLRSKRRSSSAGSNITFPNKREAQQDYDKDAEEFDLGVLNPLNRQNSQWSAVTSHRRRLDLGQREDQYHMDNGDSSGDEVEVDGGVALTEEAVETHTPDIITQV